MMASRLSIRLFGGFEAERDGAPLPPLRSRKERWLLALLVLAHGRPRRRDALAQTLWPFPETGQPQANFNLRRSLSQIRKALGEHADLILAPTPTTVALDLAPVFADVLAFDQAVAKGDETALQEATALYRGPLLPECTEAWVLPEREARQQAYQQALTELAIRARTRGDYPAAVRLLRQAITIDPGWEFAQRQLMEALAAGGDVSGAFTIYQEFVRRLQRDDPRALPAAETTALYQTLRARARVQAGDAREAPAPASSPLARNNLPHPLTRLIGREEALEEVAVRLHQSRLVTLTGAGGVGKTRLAVASAEDLRERFTDGVCFVDLSPVVEGGFALQAIASALEVREEAGRPLAETLREFLRPRALLLVLDNCEQVLDTSAALCESLLLGCAGLKILTTSRQALRIPGETVYRVPSLETAAAADLLVERAQAADASFALTTEAARAVSRICQRLDGIPLAIELAAARVRGLSLERVAQGLEERFAETLGSSRTIAPRHRTLQALIDWSYNLLEPTERLLLRRLSVFSGGWTLEAAESVGSGESIAPQAVAGLLTSLADKSLAVFDGAAGRYRLLETVRQYAREKLEQSGQSEAVRARHRDCFLALAEAAEPELYGATQETWLERLAQEHDNFRSALDWRADDEAALRLAAALWRFWYVRGFLAEGRERVARVLAAETGGRSAARAKVLYGASGLAQAQSDYEAAARFYAAARALYQELGDREGYAFVLSGLGLVVYLIGDYEQARALLTEALAVHRETGNPRGLTFALNDLGVLYLNLKDAVSARPLHEEALALRRQRNDSHGIALSLSNLAFVAHLQGDHAAARRMNAEALAIHQAIGDKQGVAVTWINDGYLAVLQGEYATAQTMQAEALKIAREIGDRWSVALSLEVAAAALSAQGQSEYAARLWGGAETLRETIRAVPTPLESALIAPFIAATRAAQGSKAFAAAWMAGRTLTMDQAIELALEAPGAGQRIP